MITEKNKTKTKTTVMNNSKDKFLYNTTKHT